MRAVIWVQHLLGTGHTVRAASIARALMAEGVATTLVLGARAPRTLDLSGLAVRQLTPVHATDATFKTLVGEDGTPYAELMGERSADLLDTIRTERPNIVMTEAFPFGRTQLAGELIPVLGALRQERRAVLAASVRDVLVEVPEKKAALMVERAAALYDMVLVHGDPSLRTLAESVPAAAALPIVRYTGFVVPDGALPQPSEDAGEILVSSGGGRSGQALVALVLKAAALGPPQWRWRVLLPDPADARNAPANVVVERNRPDFRALLASAAVSVSQCGYNTALDVAMAGTRAIFVPFNEHGETEQMDRALLWKDRGFAAAVVEQQADADALVDAVAGALAGPPPPPFTLDVSGAATSARLLVDAARERAS